MSGPVPIKYRAFLSYSHRDTAWGRWLHSALESYRIGKDLIGRETAAGPVPKTLRPIFRDREDFSAGHSLTAQTLAALEASQFLIVICSPDAAQSKYVNEEIRRFKALGRAERVIPVIVDGEPGDGARECFPPALRFKLGSDGALTDEAEEPIAADARPQGDGKDVAKQKVVAGLLGLGLDEIRRRAEKARKRRNRFWGALAGVFLILAIAATGSAAYAWHQLKTNEEFLNVTLKTATEIVTTAVAQAEKYNVPRTATLELLLKADGLFEEMARLGRSTPELRYRKASMLIEFARNYAILGETEKRYERASEARRLLAELYAGNASEPLYQIVLGRAHIEVGDALHAQGNLAGALQAYRDSLPITEALIKAFPNDMTLLQDVAVTHNRIGGVLVFQGNGSDALVSFRASLAIVEQVARVNPNVPKWQNDLATAYDRVADVLTAQSRLDEALVLYRDSFRVREQLTKTQHGNLNWQHELAVSHSRIGDALMAQGKFDDALASFRDSAAIFNRVAQSDVHNTAWQHDVSLLLGKVGEVLIAQNKLPEALKHFRDSLIIQERLAKADPGNAGWQRDLAVAIAKVGDALARQGNLPEALSYFHQGYAIYQRLAQSDPANVHWQVELLWWHWRLAEHGDDPAGRWARIVASLRKLKAENKLNPAQEKWLPVAEQQLARFSTR